MGEFLVPIREDTMGETVASNPSLQVSVSFGRFESESLSWEKWSSFSPNKYLEEVEKCATPGSVAQKKAYFEAHYKKIAARKAEMLDLEKQAEKDLSKSENQNGEDLSGNTCKPDAQSDVSNIEGYSTKEVKQATNWTGEIGWIHVDNVEGDVTFIESRDYQSTPVEGENKELENRSDGSQQSKPEEAVHREEEEEEEIVPIEAEKVKELSPNGKNETGLGKTCQVEANDVKLDHPEEPKVNPVNRESSATKTKKKPAMPTSKAHQISTPGSSRPTPTLTNKISTPRSSRPTPTSTNQISAPRSSRPTPTPTKTLASATSSKRENYPSSSGRKNTSTGENKRVADKSLHMSFSLGPSNPIPDPVPHTTMRKSLIMEKMGDKDIVRRAFKTFRNNFDQSKTSGEAGSPVYKQVPSRGNEQKIPTSMTSRKENGRPAKLDSMEKRSGNAVRSTVRLKNDIRAAKGKESSRKMEPKSNTKEAERTRVQSKSKEEKGAETKGLKHNVRARTLPAFYGGQKVSKGRP